MRCGGEKSSSIWPERTLHIKAARKMADTDILAIRRITIALITLINYLFTKLFAGSNLLNEKPQNKT
ncbi:hypothetical protein A4D02_22925 [Niastella koreensis]|uniref:Uncharacterized protein n=1 Tax=Niastella koreensis TaxID=354356 RepID=A0ABX3P1Z3_9BACT|nr:hypothetical protein A4D02_22925 [Niastella koreensis]